MKRSLRFCWNYCQSKKYTYQYVLAHRDRFGSQHFYPEIFFMISAFSTFASKVLYCGIKIYIMIGPNVPNFCFRVDFLPAHLQTCPIEKGTFVLLLGRVCLRTCCRIVPDLLLTCCPPSSPTCCPAADC